MAQFGIALRCVEADRGEDHEAWLLFAQVRSFLIERGYRLHDEARSTEARSRASGYRKPRDYLREVAVSTAMVSLTPNLEHDHDLHEVGHLQVEEWPDHVLITADPPANFQRQVTGQVTQRNLVGLDQALEESLAHVRRHHGVATFPPHEQIDIVCRQVELLLEHEWLRKTLLLAKEEIQNLRASNRTLADQVHDLEVLVTQLRLQNDALQLEGRRSHPSEASVRSQAGSLASTLKNVGLVLSILVGGFGIGVPVGQAVTDEAATYVIQVTEVEQICNAIAGSFSVPESS